MQDNTPKNDGLRAFDKDIRAKFNQQPAELQERQRAAKTFILYPFELKENMDKTFEEKETETLELICNHLTRFKKAYVATSYGMDSIVLMHIVIRAAKMVDRPIPDMWLNDTLNIFKEEKQYWEDMTKFLGVEKQFKKFTPPVDKVTGKQQTVWTIAEKFGHLPSFRSMTGRGEAYKKSHTGEIVPKVKGGGQTPECCNILKKASMKDFMKKMPKEERYDLHFIGTRAEESRMRQMSVLQRCRSYLITSMFPHPIRAVTPLSYWRKADIMEYYARYEIPKNPAYKAHNLSRMGCASCPAHKNWEARLAIDPSNEGFGMLKMNLNILKKTDPERLVGSLDVLQRVLDGKIKAEGKIDDKNRARIEAMIVEFTPAAV